MQYALLLFGNSEWLGDTLVRNPSVLVDLVGEKGLDRSLSRDSFEARLNSCANRSSQGEVAELLSGFRKREYIRILLRDLLGIAPLAETTGEISALSDVLIEYALRETEARLHEKHGRPQWIDDSGTPHDCRFAVLGLGKLGGNELNYSSDVDLLYLYDGADESPPTGLSHREYFIRLAQQTTELLARHNREGQAFRIDLRLRPQGSQEELAVAMSHAVDYYRNVAQDWELQALIKARHAAGDVSLSREFLDAVRPQVYRPELNLPAIKTALQMREKIERRRRQRPPIPAALRGIDVKLDRGGIRDIEFLVQCLQRVYGGSEPWLRSRGTLFALQKLHDKEHITGRDYHRLTGAYVFLRNVEHRLQVRRGQQTHRVPNTRGELEALARSLSSSDARPLAADSLLEELRSRMAGVAEIYQRVIYHQQSQSPSDDTVQADRSFHAWAVRGRVYGQLVHRLLTDVPGLSQVLDQPDLSAHGRANFDRFLSSATANPERYKDLITAAADIGTVRRALQVFELSDHLTEILVRHPGDLVLLGGAGENSDLKSLREQLSAGAPPIATDGSEAATAEAQRTHSLERLRRHFRQRLFVASVRSLFDDRDIYSNLAGNTSAADEAIRAALAISGPCDGLAIMALGRLGSFEFDVLSDADLVFVSDDGADQPVLRLTALRTIEALTTYTSAGTVFAVDARLRPHGQEGELLATTAQLQTYWNTEAKPWEALSYLRLRFVAGDERVATRVLALVRESVPGIVAQVGFAAELAELRGKLEKSDSPHNLKTGPGGTYDIDYLVGELQLRHQVWMTGNLRDRIRVVSSLGLLAPDEAQVLEDNALFLRTLEHWIRLVSGKPGKWLPAGEHGRRSLQRLLQQDLPDSEGRSAEVRLATAMEQTRALYEKHRER